MTDTTAAATTTDTPTGEVANTDGKPADTATGDPQAAQQPDTTTPQDAKPAEPVVPESYDLKMPEGVELDKAAAEEFTALAKEMKLDQATAQKVADVGAKMAQRRAEAHATLVQSWADSAKTDKEFGGDKFAENLAVARKAMDTFGTPELKSLLDSTGLGNNPEVIRAFFRAGRAISEDGFVRGQGTPAQTDTAKKLFPNMN